MPPALILALALAAGCAIAIYQRSRSLDTGAAAGNPLGDSAGPSSEPIATADAPAAADTTFSAGQTMLDSWGSTVTKLFELPATAAPYADHIAQVESAQGLPSGLLGRLLYQESRFRPDIISGATKSPVGALGIAQFMPATAKDVGVDPLDPFASIEAAGRYLKGLYNQTGSWAQALGAYNWGIGNVKRKGLDKAPAETRAYVSQILSDVSV